MFQRILAVFLGRPPKPCAGQTESTATAPQVTLNFNSSHIVPLPAWVLEMGKDNPDIFYADRAGVRSYECLSLGVDDGEAAL